MALDRPIPGLWRQMPESWGPVEAVQLSLFHNAEAIGIDPATIAIACPILGPGSQINYGYGEKSGIDNGAEFESGGLNLTSDGYATIPSPTIATSLAHFTAFLEHGPINFPGNSSTVFFHGISGYSNTFSIVRATTTSAINFYIQGFGLSFSSTTYNALLTEGVSAFTYGHPTAHYFKDGKELENHAFVFFPGYPGSFKSSGILLGRSVTGTTDTRTDYIAKQFLLFSECLDDDIIKFISENPGYLWRPSFPTQFSNIAADSGTILDIADAAHTHSADSVTFDQHHVLSVAEAHHGQSADDLTFTQHHLLSMADAIHGHLADSVTLDQHHTLSVPDALHGQSADGISFTQHHQLAVNDATHGHSADGLTLVFTPASGFLPIESATHAHTADGITFTQHHLLSAANALHGQAAGGLSLTQHHELSISDAAHGQAVDGVSLAQHHVLSINASGHIQLADNIDLTQHHLLTVNDSGHAHTVDSLNLIHTPPTGVLAIQSATHGQTADEVQLTQHNIFSIPDAAHGHLAENPEFMQHHSLAAAEAQHGHTADMVALVYHPATMQLSIQNAAHLQLTDRIALTQHHALAVQDAIHHHAAEAFIFSLPRGIVRAVFEGALMPAAKFLEPKKPNVIITEIGGS